MTFDLEGKKILLTGASGGIGSAIAHFLDKLGANLALSGTNKEKLEALSAKLHNSPKILTADLSNAESAANLVNNAAKELEGLDGLICNAGVTSDGLFVRMNFESWKKVIDINLNSTFLLNKEACKIMMRQRHGKIVNIASVVGFTGNPGQANYCAAKAGIIGLSKSIAKEFATKNVLINCIAPGFIKTPMTDKLNDNQKDSIKNHIPMQRIGDPQEICGATAFLLSDLASYITGQTIHINGGMYM